MRRPRQGGLRAQRTSTQHLLAHLGPMIPVVQLLFEAVSLEGLIGLDSRGMGLKQRNALLLPASPLPTHLCHSPITAHNHPSLLYSSPNLKHPPHVNTKVIFLQ